MSIPNVSQNDRWQDLRTWLVTAGYNLNMYDAKKLGTNVMIARRDLRMTQETLAEAVGVSRAYVTNIEMGRGDNVGIGVIFNLAGALGVSVGYLLGLEESAIGERDLDVLREQAGDYIAVDAESPEQRRAIQQAAELFASLTASAQAHALRYLATVRRMEEEERRRLAAHELERAEVDAWVNLLSRFDEPTRAAVARLVGIPNDGASAPGGGGHKSVGEK